MNEFLKNLKTKQLLELTGGVKITDISSTPKGLEVCNSAQRIFPLSWKEAYFRMNFNEEYGGYVCPICKKLFRGTKGFGQLRADHIRPFAKRGLTVWSNLQLLCVKCNSQKSDNLSVLE